MNTYQPGDAVVLTCTIRDSSGLVYDPAALKFHYLNAASALTTKVYGTDSDVLRLSSGVYSLTIYVPYATGAAGNWEYDVQALNAGGSSLVVENKRFAVAPIATVG